MCRPFTSAAWPLNDAVMTCVSAMDDEVRNPGLRIEIKLLSEKGGRLMLVLTRKCNEKIVVGKTGGAQRDCLITVISIRGSKVRLGVDADPQTPVRRAEIACRIRSDAQEHDSK